MAQVLYLKKEVGADIFLCLGSWSQMVPNVTSERQKLQILERELGLIFFWESPWLAWPGPGLGRPGSNLSWPGLIWPCLAWAWPDLACACSGKVSECYHFVHLVV